MQFLQLYWNPGQKSSATLCYKIKVLFILKCCCQCGLILPDQKNIFNLNFNEKETDWQCHASVARNWLVAF